ncbi:MAG: class I SAM-dependent methyltransferase [Gaiellaceae bacterium]
MELESGLESFESAEYAAEWVDDDVLADLLELPRRLSAALVEDAGIDVEHVLDVGSGHGPYLALFLRAFPDASGTWTDSSEAMRDLAREPLGTFGDRIRYVLADAERLDQAELEPADVVLTSRVFHHFSPESLQRTYRAVHELTKPGGFFFNLDHIGPAPGWEARYRRIRPRFVGKRQRALKPHRHDFPLRPIREHLTWLEDAGFEAPDVPWRTLYTALIAARRPG